jgi:D-amino-acid dehydrogenase
MPDSLPVIGRATKFANVVYAFGHGHVGLCGAAPTANLVAEMIGGRPTNIDITPYRPDRF